MEQTMASKLQKTNKSMVQTWLITCRFQQMELKKKSSLQLHVLNPTINALTKLILSPLDL